MWNQSNVLAKDIFDQREERDGHREMNEDSLWKQFATTGKVQDYLSYARKKEKIRDTTAQQRKIKNKYSICVIHGLCKECPDEK